jgi:hypothetical protein
VSNWRAREWAPAVDVVHRAGEAVGQGSRQGDGLQPPVPNVRIPTEDQAREEGTLTPVRIGCRGAEVRIAGITRTHANRHGIARFYIPLVANYAVTVVANGVEEVLYEEALEPGKAYVYRPDPEQAAGRYFVLTED